MADLTMDRAFVEEVLHKSNTYRHVKLTVAQKAELCRAWLALHDLQQEQRDEAGNAGVDASRGGER